MAADRDAAELGKLLGLIVHDLRNPTSTIGANLAYLKEAGTGGDPDADEAVVDAETAVAELMRGLEQVAWIAQWLAGEPATRINDGDVVVALRMVTAKERAHGVTSVVPEGPLRARGGGTLPRLLDVLLANSAHHARGPAELRAYRDGDEVVVEVRDDGASVSEELRELVFQMEGQHEVKNRADGRYGRVAGLFAARLLAEAMGARLEADEDGGKAVFRVRLKSV